MRVTICPSCGSDMWAGFDDVERPCAACSRYKPSPSRSDADVAGGSAPAPSPLENVSAWRDEELEHQANRALAGGYTAEDAEDIATLLNVGLIDLAAARADIADAIADWRGDNRGREFRWGLAELEAERRAVTEVEVRVRKAIAAADRIVKKHNQAENKRLQEEAAARRQERQLDSRGPQWVQVEQIVALPNVSYFELSVTESGRWLACVPGLSFDADTANDAVYALWQAAVGAAGALVLTGADRGPE